MLLGAMVAVTLVACGTPFDHKAGFDQSPLPPSQFVSSGAVAIALSH
jgi:hypothetical protein